MPLFGGIKRTYSKKQETVSTLNSSLGIFTSTKSDEKENHKRKVNLSSSLDDSLWKDSFDKLLDDKNILRENKIIKKTINASYNRDSSKEKDSFEFPVIFPKKRGRKIPSSYSSKKIKKTVITKDSIKAPAKIRPTRKRKKDTHLLVGDAVISTPVGGKKAKQTNNLSFDLSPIFSRPILSLNDVPMMCYPRKGFESPNITTNGEKPVKRFFNFNHKQTSLIGNPQVEINLSNSNVQDLMKTIVKAVTETNKDVIEISHTDDENLENILQKTNPETLINLALIPKNSVDEVLEQSMKSCTVNSFLINKTAESSKNVTRNTSMNNHLTVPQIIVDSHNSSSIPNLPETSLNENLKSGKVQNVTQRKNSKSCDKIPDKSENEHSTPFHGFNESSLYVTKRSNKTRSKNATPITSPIIEVETSHDQIRDERSNITTGTIDLTEDRPEGNLVNCFSKTVLHENDQEIVNLELSASNSVPTPAQNIDRNEVTHGIIDLSDYPDCNHQSKTLSPVKNEYQDISVIPPTPINITVRRSRRRTTKSVRLPENPLKKMSLLPEPISTAPCDVSVIDCTITETTVAIQRRTLRRQTRRNVQFNKPLSPLPEISDNLSQRKTVEFDDKNHEDNFSSINLAPGKWRKSLAAWKRKTLAMSVNETNCKETNSTRFSRAEISTHKISVVRKSDGRWLSKRMTIIKDEENEDQQELVLEPTTDETCNLSALSLRDSEEDSDQEEKKQLICRKSSIKLQRSHSSSIDESRNNRSLYRRQLSTRLRKTSVYERTQSLSFYSQHPANDLLLILPHISSRDVVLRLCKQSEPLSFNEIYSQQALRCCRKIGEGVYSEVFMYKNQNRTVVLKVIPVEGDQLVNGEPQKRFDEIQSEIIIAQELTKLQTGDKYMTNGFVEAVNVRCVQGRYPSHLIDLWELYDENRTSDNDHPELFKDNQLFIVFEQANGGQDLEAFQFDNALQSHSAFIQVAITLAIAEKRLEFEHRDLHWGNVLLSNTDDSHVTFKIDGKSIQVPTYGVKATIIDFTLSRMVADGVRLYNDLAQDDELFSATGDYQFDIYRFMKSRLDNCWERFEPYTNILWLHYLVDKMINGARYKNSKSKKHRSAVDQLMQLRDEILDYKSAADYVQCIYNNNN